MSKRGEGGKKLPRKRLKNKVRRAGAPRRSPGNEDAEAANAEKPEAKSGEGREEKERERCD